MPEPPGAVAATPAEVARSVVDAALTDALGDNACTSDPPVKTNYIGSPACLLLDQALMAVHAAFPDALGIYQVGSSLQGPDWRDIDLRMILTDDDFGRLFGDPVQMGRINAFWSLFCASVSRHLSHITGLPIDFQVQGMTRANVLHKGPREPLGIFVRPATEEPDHV